MKNLIIASLLMNAAVAAETKTVKCGLSRVDPPLCSKAIPVLQKQGWRIQSFEEKSGIDSTWRVYTLTRTERKKGK